MTLQRMSHDDRQKAIRAAIDGDDDAFAVAAISGSPVLTGVGPAE